MIERTQYEEIVLATLFAEDTLDVACPACSHLTQLSVVWLQTNGHYACEKCGSELQIDGEQLLERLKDVDLAVENLKSSIDRLKEML